MSMRARVCANESELEKGFFRQVRRWRVSRTAWLFFDYVCKGERGERERLVAAFDRYCENHPPKRYVPKWAYAIEWYKRHGAER